MSAYTIIIVSLETMLIPDRSRLNLKTDEGSQQEATGPITYICLCHHAIVRPSADLGSSHVGRRTIHLTSDHPPPHDTPTPQHHNPTTSLSSPLR